MNAVLLLASLLVVPGLLGLMMLMSWLERTFTQYEIADELADLLATDPDADRLEVAVARIARPLFPATRR